MTIHKLAAREAEAYDRAFDAIALARESILQDMMAKIDSQDERYLDEVPVVASLNLAWNAIRQARRVRP